MRPYWVKIIGLALGLVCCGCAARSQIQPPAAQDAVRSITDQVSHTNATLLNANNDRLARLWSERQNQPADFPIGPGDVLEISVPGIDELQDRTARVDGNGHIFLPIVGDLEVAGKTEKQIRAALNKRLEKVLYHPQADLFVKKYRSRWVAVMGAVGQPGMYVLDGPEDTVRELIERAGGVTSNAAERVVLTPGGLHQGGLGTLERADVEEPASPRPLDSADRPTLIGDQGTRTSAGPDGLLVDRSPLDGSELSGDSGPVLIDLSTNASSEHYLNLPVRPGDTIFVPIAGSVTVIGWVYHPKTMPISPGLTVLGAVSAAGGPLFAADTSAVKVIRQKSDGRSTILTVDLNKVEDHEAANTPVSANDIIDVSYSAAKLPGYAVYYAVRGIFGWAPAAAVVSGVP